MSIKEEKIDKTNAEVVQEEIENFLRLTAIKSLQFAQHSANWMESIVWIILLVGGSALAIRDVRKVCEVYTNEDTYTSMSVNNLQNLTLDDAIICIGYDPRALNLSDHRLIRHAESRNVVGLARRANTSSVELLNRLLKLVTAITLVEHGRTADFEKKVQELERGDDLQQLQNWLRTERVDISTLWREIGSWLCHSVRLRIDTIKRGNLNSSVNPCEHAKISWLGVIPLANFASSLTSVCVDIGSKITFGSMFDRVVISINTEGLFPSLLASENGYYLSSQFDFSGDPVATDTTRGYVTFPEGGCLPLEIGVGAKLRLIDRWLARCNATAKTRFQCFAGCNMLLSSHQRLANCTLLTMRYLYSSNSTLCFDIWSIQEHVDSRRLLSHGVAENCWASCLFPCEYRQYDVGPAVDKCDKNYANATTDGVSIELNPKRFSVPVFEEHYVVGASDLFSRIGGTCGIWLGVGLVGIFHALLFPVRLMMKLLAKSKCSKSAEIEIAVELR